MKPRDHLLPDNGSVLRGLNSILRKGGSSTASIQLSYRERSKFSSFYPSEIITCNQGEKPLRLLCKYYRNEFPKFADRGGPPYETLIYSEILERVSVATAKFYGYYSDLPSGWYGIVLEYLAGAKTLRTSQWLIQAAQWLGRFHAVSGEYSDLPGLITHERDYLNQWAERLLAIDNKTFEEFPWLDNACNDWYGMRDVLFTQHPLVIHGEFYPRNILVHGDTIFPIDWETTAVSIGELDFAALTEGWPCETVKLCEQVYSKARWGTGISQEFETTIKAARVYWHLRWLYRYLERRARRNPNERGAERQQFEKLKIEKLHKSYQQTTFC